MQKKLNLVPLADERQITFGTRLGLDLVGCTLRVAGARIEDCIRSDFYGESLHFATEKQVALAAELGYDIPTVTRRVAHAIIEDIFEQMDRETIIAEELAPGVTVTNIRDRVPRHHVISSIQQNLLVYYKGGNGKKAYARNLRRVTRESADSLEQTESVVTNRISPPLLSAAAEKQIRRLLRLR